MKSSANLGSCGRSLAAPSLGCRGVCSPLTTSGRSNRSAEPTAWAVHSEISSVHKAVRPVSTCSNHVTTAQTLGLSVVKGAESVGSLRSRFAVRDTPCCLSVFRTATWTRSADFPVSVPVPTRFVVRARFCSVVDRAASCTYTGPLSIWPAAPNEAPKHTPNASRGERTCRSLTGLKVFKLGVPARDDHCTTP